MNYIFMITCLLSWILPLSLFATKSYALSYDNSQAIAEEQTLTKTIDLVYNHGRIDARINNAQIGKIFEMLKIKAGIQFDIYDPSIDNLRVSALFKGITLERAIRKILEDFSYVFYTSDEAIVVIVLSDTSDKVKTYGNAKFLKNVTPVRAETNVNYVADTDNETIPKSLEEFQQIKSEAQWSEYTDEVTPDNSKHPLSEKRYQQALVERAQEIISSKHEHLHQEALNQLIGINNSSATEMLIDATTWNTQEIPRIQAVEALWQHAVNLQFKDTVSINALKQLMNDDNREVSQVAFKAVREIELIHHSAE